MQEEPQSLSIHELQEYWRDCHALRSNETIRVLSFHELPPWEVICRLLDWRVRQITGGYFSDKNYGRPGVYRLVALETQGDLKKFLPLDGPSLTIRYTLPRQA